MIIPIMIERNYQNRKHRAASGQRTREQKHMAFLDLDVTKDPIVYDTKDHVAPVLVEPFLSEQ